MEQDLHLDRLKKGVKVVALDARKKGLDRIGGVFIVLDFYEKTNRWRYTTTGRPDRVAGAFGVDGGAFNSMSRSETPDYYFSANPEHVKQSENRSKHNEIERKRKAEQDRKALEEFEAELKLLQDKYGVELQAEQTAGDDQGVEVALFATKNNEALIIDND